MLLGLVVVGAIIAVVLMIVGFDRDDPVPLIVINGNSTSNSSIVTGTTSTDAGCDGYHHHHICNNNTRNHYCYECKKSRITSYSFYLYRRRSQYRALVTFFSYQHIHPPPGLDVIKLEATGGD